MQRHGRCLHGGVRGPLEAALCAQGMAHGTEASENSGGCDAGAAGGGHGTAATTAASGGGGGGGDGGSANSRAAVRADLGGRLRTAQAAGAGCAGGGGGGGGAAGRSTEAWKRRAVGGADVAAACANSARGAEAEACT